MASSSKSSRPTTASSSWPSTYDVFLNFRGADTRRTFVDHLYAALEQHGIYTYVDEVRLPRGESIGPSLLNAIKESQIAVIVFSQNYANSSWCLDELVAIMECMDETGQTVIPIFYDVEPSDVRKQQGAFGEAFAKHEVENSSKVESWRKVLVRAANLSGFEPRNMADGHESKCIKEIVKEISDRLRHFISRAKTDLIGIESRVKDLRSQLEIVSRRVRMVGIWGIGGGGKTTLAFSIYNEISNEFDGCCFVENIREESNKFGLKTLQEKVLLDVLKLNVAVRNVEEGKGKIAHRLSRKSVIIVLDDVNHTDQLMALAGSHDWFGEGSLIIITTRNQHLLVTHKVDVIHTVNLLTGDEAIRLFSKHAFGDDFPGIDLRKLMQNIVSYASGLPLALKVLGSFLCGKSRNEWTSALERLRQIPDEEILRKLTISYDGLQRDEKEIFLDLACFFRRWRQDEAMMILDACGFHSTIGVKVLIEKALVTISDGRFDMHDLIQEMGHYIIQEEHPYNPEKRSRIMRIADVLSIYSGDATKKNNKTRTLQVHSYGSSPECLPKVVGNMMELRLLDVHTFNNEDGGSRLDRGPEFLSNKLRWMSWEGYPASLLPATFQASELRGLVLQGGLQKQLWNGFKNLQSLKVLDLSYSKNLIRTPDFNGCQSLERLILYCCISLIEIHSSIGYHESLVFLDLRNCRKLKLFPPIVRMHKLETLQLSCCSRLRKFPEIQTNMDSLVNLCLDGSGIKVVPSSIGQYCTNLISIDLSGCPCLTSIEGNFHLLQRLKKLNFHGCTRLEKLPEDLFDVECCIEELSLPPKIPSPSSKSLIMKRFKNLFNSIWLQFFHQDLVSMEFPHLPHFLKKLNLSWCNLVDGDLSDIGELSNLQVLDLSGNNFVRLHSSLLLLSGLKFLNISNCKRLVELPELPSNISVLKADGCDSLEMVEHFPTNCKWLWKVSFIRGESNLGSIGGERVLQSMLQGNAIESHFISLRLQDHEIPKGFVRPLAKEEISPLQLFQLQDYEIPKGFVRRLAKGERFSLQLPDNWYNGNSGFIMCAALMVRYNDRNIKITMRWGMDIDYLYDSWEVSNEATMSGYYPITCVGYVSFSSLIHTAWWNSTYNMILFSFDREYDDIFEYDDMVDTGFGVELVSRSEGDPLETTQSATDCSEFWDKEYEDRKTFSMVNDSQSALEILWLH